jgi:hypothetical protein
MNGAEITFEPHHLSRQRVWPCKKAARVSFSTISRHPNVYMYAAGAPLTANNAQQNEMGFRHGEIINGPSSLARHANGQKVKATLYC